MSDRQKRNVLIGVTVIACCLAAAVIAWHNKSLWEWEPYPGGESARVRSIEWPWIATGISDLQWFYSPWLGLLIIQALSGATGSVLYTPARVGIPLACSFLYSFIGFLLSMLLIPLFIGFVGLAICWAISVRQKVAAANNWLVLCLWHNCLLVIVGFAYDSKMWSVYGD